MCGIALIICGIRFELFSLVNGDSTPQAELSKQSFVFSIDDLEAALRRRGPDSLGTKKLSLQAAISRSSGDRETATFIEELEAVQSDDKSFGFSLANDRTGNVQSFAAELRFIGATLQLRGTSPVVQPLVDNSKNILVYNGEIFGGIRIGSDENDAEILMRELENCCSCYSQVGKRACHCDESGKSSVVDVLSRVRGPWAIIYWQDSSRTLWFGRDAFGRRSLLVHWPTMEDSRFLLSSVSPISPVEQSSDVEPEHGSTSLRFWEELPCGIYSMTIDAPNCDGFLVSEVRKHEWADAMLDELIKWERTSVEPKPEELHASRCKTLLAQQHMHLACSDILPSESEPIQASVLVPAETVLIALRESVRRRSSLHSILQADMHGVEKELSPIAVLFSGGLDSMILAALLNECLDPRYEIDLLNVSFDGQSAPDRISAKAGVNELRRIALSRKWKLVEIDSDLSALTFETKHVMSLISPANTYMDLNIGIALWLAAGGEGWVCEGHGHPSDEDYLRVRCRSKARILLVGSGADEQCAGYGRHRTKYRNGSWLGLHEEMKLDMQRIWKRNLGRDDRCIADNGKEARFPFLDEDVIKVLLDIPLWEVADLDQPSGVGDKKILREMANQTEEPAQPSAQIVGNAFIQQYYLALHKAPDVVHKFYADSSMLSRPGPDGVMTSATTTQGINEIILSLNYQNYHTQILSADAQFSHKDGVIVLVTGCLTGNNEKKKFAQSFFLAPQSQDKVAKNYFVLNDVFRFVDDVADNDTDGTSPTPTATPIVELTSVAEQPVPSETISVEEEVNPSNAENQVGELVDIEKELIAENGGVALENGLAEENGHAEENVHAENPVDSSKNVAHVNVITEAPVSKLQEDAPKKSFASVVNALNKNAAPFHVRVPLPRPAVQPRSRAPAVPKPEAPAPASAPPANGAPERNDDHAAKAHAIFVANLPMNATVEELDKLFKQFGPIKHDGIQVRSNKQQGACFGFVEFESASSMQSALEASPVVFGSRKLSIEERRANNDRAKFPSGRSGYRSDNFRGGRGNYNSNRGYGRNEFEKRGEFSGRPRGNGHAGRNGEAHQKPTSNGGDKAAQEAPVKAA